MIIKAIEYCTADQALVTSFISLADDCKKPNYWSDTTLEKLKGRVKDHYIEVQGKF